MEISREDWTSRANEVRLISMRRSQREKGEVGAHFVSCQRISNALTRILNSTSVRWKGEGGKGKREEMNASQGVDLGLAAS